MTHWADERGAVRRDACGGIWSMNQPEFIGSFVTGP